MKAIFVLFLWIVGNIAMVSTTHAIPADEDGYKLWLRYPLTDDSTRLTEYQANVTKIVVPGYTADAMLTNVFNELRNASQSMLGTTLPTGEDISLNGCIVAGTPATSSAINALGWNADLAAVGNEGFVIRSATINGFKSIVIASNGKNGVLYGAFRFLRVMQTQQTVQSLNISEKPKVQLRLLNHFDNADGSIERGYAGNSLWKWSDLPGTLSPRYTDYARACASVGINGAVLNNVDADPIFISSAYILKEKAIADVFRSWGVKVYLVPFFASPISLGGLTTADPLNANVITFWNNKATEIYSSIPDFGGFLVKANSEGQPGPADYGRTHAQGANCFGNAVAPYGGNVLWRAFVYGSGDPDRAKQAYQTFTPLDGQFNSNCMVQVKYGPLDYQPLEAFHPLFGKMPNTKLSLEFEITQEYVGQATHLVYLAPLWKEYLDSDTYANNVAGNTVGNVIDGSVYGNSLTAMSGVANTGDNTNWCGHHFAQANWYAFGRLAWDHTLDASVIADEWARMTWSNQTNILGTVKAMMMGSWQALHDYQEPIGLNFLCDTSIHYNPDPKDRTTYHKADTVGLGYDRTATTGSNAVGQYNTAVANLWNDPNNCPEEYLLWFQHVSWTRTMDTGRTLWNELCYRYYSGVNYVTNMQGLWQSLNGLVDNARYSAVSAKLTQQVTDSTNWRDTCLKYFGTFSGKTISTTTALKLDAEYGAYSGAVFQKSALNYLGRGYVSYTNNSNDWLEWQFYVPTNGAYALSFRYANGGTSDRPLQLSNNGSVVTASLSFPTTGSWNTWKNVAQNVILHAGVNTIRLTAIGSSGANFDLMEVAPGVNHAPTALSLSNASVSENRAVGTLVGQFSATDSDAGDSFTYSLVPGTGSTDNALFMVSSNVLGTATPLDYEAAAARSVRIRVTDLLGATFEQAFVITVINDPNEYADWSASLPVGRRGANDDPNGDGFCNLAAYAFGYLANETVPTAVRPAMTANPDGTLCLAFVLPVNSPPDVRYQLTRSGDLISWMTLATKDGSGSWQGTAVPTTAATADGRIRVSLIVPKSSSPAFYRLGLTQITPNY